MSQDSPAANWRKHLRVHPAAELFPRPSEAELKELAEDIRINGQRVPIAVCMSADGKTLAVVDGVSRLDAMALTGLLNIDSDGNLYIGEKTVRFTAVDTDPYEAAISLNIHRRHLTAEDKRDLIAKVLKAKPEASNATVAKQVRADDKTVAKVRRELESRSEIPNVNVRTDTKGRKQPSTKPKKSSKPTSPPKTDPIGSSPVGYSEAPATPVSPESRPRSVSPRDIALDDFSARAMELVRLTRNKSAARFAKTSLSDGDIRQLATFFAALLESKHHQDKSTEVSIEQRKAEHAMLDKGAE